MHEAYNSISTPMMSESIIFAHQGDSFLDLRLYRSTVGALQYVAVTHLEMTLVSILKFVN